MARAREISARLIRSIWTEYPFHNHFKPWFGHEQDAVPSHIVCLKDSYKSSVWRMNIRNDTVKLPVILKVFKPRRRPRQESIVEMNLYRLTYKRLRHVMPRIYTVKRNINGGQTWAFIEYVRPLYRKERSEPRDLKRIIPALAELHSRTWKLSSRRYKALFSDWLPHCRSGAWKRERAEIRSLQQKVLDDAMKLPHLSSVLLPHYSNLKKVLAENLEVFPEVLKAGMSVTHSDLQLPNIGIRKNSRNEREVVFIDWEGCKYAPCWFDVVNLIGIYFAYHPEHKTNESDWVRQLTGMYAEEMKKRGIVFPEEPLVLYKKAYLKLILEQYLYLQLSWEVDGRKKALLLPVFLEIFHNWGKEYKLF